ncbi:MAG: MBL fold metallo-hydrolase [Treponema sp.]|nr:MBL fold metallo-hydrolase [Treponema sp.]
MKKIMILIIAVLLVVTFPLYAVLFLPGVGGKPTKEDRADYVRRAPNFDGKAFHNEEEVDVMVKDAGEDENKASTKDVRPKTALPVMKPSFSATPSENDFTITWFGHSSLLVQVAGKNILLDPVFSEKLSPVSWIGISRFTPCPVTVSDLPEIDLMILSHDHYDHLDYKVMKEISAKVKRVIVPLGVEAHLRKWKFDMDKVENLAWWEESVGEDGLTVACTPAQHFSGRWLTGRNQTLWASWVLKAGGKQIFYNGDSGFSSHYERIHEKYGDFDFALMECGQYNKRWASIHSFPEEGGDAMKILGARLAMPIHWGAFVLARHAWDDSVERFSRHAEETGLNFITPKIGETVDLTKEDLSQFQEKWWREIE